MNAWMEQLAKLIRTLVERESAAEMWILTGACILAGLLLFKKLSALMGGANHWWRALVLFFSGLALMAAAAAAAALVNGGWLFLAGGALLALLAVAVPVTAALERVSYLTALLVWAVCCAAVAAILLIENPVMDTFDKGAVKAEQLKEHRLQTEEYQK
jgi:hypothetical protein